MLTVRCSPVIAALVAAVLHSPITASAVETNALDSMKATYEKTSQKLQQTCQRRERDALKQYDKSLEKMLATLKRKGDLDTYLIVEKEQKRFSAVRAVPAETNTLPAIAPLMAEYRKAVTDAHTELTEQTITLMRQYVIALDNLIKQLMQADRIEDAKTVKDERVRIGNELATLVSKASRTESPSMPSSQAPTTPQVPTQNAQSPSNQTPLRPHPTSVAGKPVPKEAEEFHGHHYLFVPEKVSWHDAKKACEEMGGHLITVTSTEENDFFHRVRRGQRAWVGLTDEGKEIGRFEWITGERSTFSYPWGRGQPNRKDDSHYVHYSDPVGGWNNNNRWGRFGYVCEWDY